MKIEINVNQKVKVKLTEKALRIMQERFDEFNKKYNEDIKLPIDVDGYYHTQLWILMKDFGYMFQGCYSPISDCKIIIDDSEVNYE